MTNTPLQTHGLHEESWHPPSGRFVKYEQMDESWMRPLGLGCIRRTPTPLYDVRLERSDSLVGYSDVNPSEWIRRRGRCMNIATINARPAMCYPRGAVFGDCERKIHAITVRVGVFSILDQLFDAWCVRDELDAAALLEAGWIKVIGRDDIDRMAYDLQMQARKSAYY